MNDPIHARARPLAIALTALLAACGGGGGSGDPEPADPGYSLSGSIAAAPGVGLDSDVNDPVAPYRENDTPASAQALSGPTELNGYANLAGQGSSGRSRAPGDPQDHYRVQLDAGETVTLFVADPAAGDLDLELLDDTGQALDGSYGVGELEQVVAPAAGTYVVRVYVHRGAANYVLNTGGSEPLAIPGALRLADDFVPGEVVARYKAGARTKALGGARTLAVEGRALGLATAAAVPGAEQLLAIQDSRRQSQAYDAGEDGAALRARKRETLLAIKALRADPAVETASPNFVRRRSPLGVSVAGTEIGFLATSNDPRLNQQWHYPLIQAPRAWDVTRGDADVIVAVIDTGVLLGHPDLQGQLVPGYDFISDPGNALDGDGWDSNPDDPGDDFPRSSFHGTHVAGTVAAATNNGLGVAGVAGGVRVMPLRVLGAWGGSSFDIMQAVRYAAGLPNAAGVLPTRRAGIINLSLGGYGWSYEEAAVYAAARAQGVIVVAAAGNDATSTPHFPSSYPGVLSVSAVGPDKARAGYSNFGPDVDLAAPGGHLTDNNSDYRDDTDTDNVWSTLGSDASGSVQYAYGSMCGTSMASPHVAGVLALMRSVDASLTPERVDQLLANGALTEDLGAPGRDNQFGYGLVDAARALAALQGGGYPPVPAVTANPASLSFGPAETARTLTLGDGGTGAHVTGVSPDQPWLQVVAPAAASGLGAWQVLVNRQGLTAGTWRAILRITSDAGVLDVPVSVQVAASDAIAGGIQYAALLRDDGTPVQVLTVRPERGSYQFRFTDVPAGRYRLAAGTDLNNDGRLCDAGEACGYYGGATPSILAVTRSESGLAIDAGFITRQGGGLGARTARD